MSGVYCGNNLNAVENRKIGTRHQCFKRGVGIGLGQPIDNQYSKAYQPIDNRKKWCGDGSMPEKYDVIGNNAECMQLGIGVGKRLKYTRGIWSEWATFLIIFLIVSIISMLYFYLRFQQLQITKSLGIGFIATFIYIGLLWLIRILY